MQKLRQLIVDIWQRVPQILSGHVSVKPHLQGVPYWSASALVGLMAVIYSGAFTSSIELVRQLFQAHPYFLFITSPICFFFATWVVERFAPEAAGTGIPRVIQALDLELSQQDQVGRILNLRVALVVVVSSLLGVLGAGSLGREGPMVHLAACVFYVVGRSFRNLFPFIEHRSWILAGGAAGVAAAFNAPLAGVVFVIEELAQAHFHQFKTVVISSAIIGGVISQWLSGRYLYFGYPEVRGVTLSSLPWAVLVGVLCGIFALPFHKMLRIDWKRHLPHYLRTRLAFSVVIGFCMAALAIYVNPGTLGGGVSVIEDLLFQGHRATWSLVIGRLVGTVASHLSGCAGGFLAPALGLGAAIGSLLATITEYSNHNLLVMVGMSAFLSAIVRAPFTAWVIVMEMTDRHQAIFPLMIASLVSYGTVQTILDRKSQN
ncbi:MAG: chloride channel protein [Deltaproteobacteria bacterium]|nr:chloride channel protein [Deltaproteobacteria bacterium]